MKTLMPLENILELNNNNFLRLTDNANNLPQNILDIKKLNLTKIVRLKTFLLKIDFNELNKKSYKKILKKLLFIKKIYKNKIGILENSKKSLGYVINYDENNKDHNDFILAINAIFFKTRLERYNYIYDTVCNYLDNVFYKKNVCDFKNNKCGEKRVCSSVVGCCRHYKYKLLGPLYPKWVECEHLTNEYKCGAKCISCKLYTCDYLKRKGIEFKIKDILLLNVFFRPLQKYFIKYCVYTPKEKIIKRLMVL